MLNVPEAMWDTWQEGRFVGDNKPVTRALVSKRVLKRDGESPWRMIHFGQSPETVEIPNIKTVEIDRRLGAEAATMNMTILNTIGPTAQDFLDEAHDGSSSPTKRDLKDLGQPGAFTFRRGIAVDDSGLNRWSHNVDALWVDMLIPNRVIYTFQGYGTDGSGSPEQDANLVLTGIWMIDRVEYRSDALINIQCRDAGKLLIEQRLYPPIIPLDDYPLEFCADHIETDTITRTETSTTTQGVPESLGPNVARLKTSGYLSSNTPWYGANGSIYGHRASHAFDGDESTYWLSVGNSGPTQVWSFEWIGADCRGEPINQIRFKQKWGGYRVYIGVKENGKWQGSSIVPYGANSGPAYPNGSNIPYIKTFRTAHNNNWITVDLPKTYNADEIRIVFTDLHDSNLGTYQYRAAVYEVRAHYYQPSTIETITTTTEISEEIENFIAGNANDYVDIVKLFLAWSGFFWPNSANPDPLLDSWFDGTLGRVWGDFFQSGAFPVEPPCIPPSYWDNKSVMDGINQIKEILGYIFYIDSSGGAVFRPPNVWKTGNFVQGLGYIGYDSLRTIDEEKVLLDYGVTIDDENLRSEIIAVSADDPSVFGVFRPGYAEGETSPVTSGVGTGDDLSLLGGQQRPMLVPNYPFGTADDPEALAAVQKFAFLVSLWIHWSYRKSKFRIPGMPAFEPDDQVRIYERVTSEVYVHYLQGVRSFMDLDQGTYYMDVETHWLGNGPDQEWVINIQDMHPALFAYLRAIGQIPDEVEEDQSKWPDDWFEYEPPELKEEYPRVEDDYSDLFPLPPGLQWPDNSIDFESTDDYDDYVVPPTGGGGSGGSGGTGGTVLNCSNSFMFDFWAPGGPRNRTPGEGGGCNYSYIITHHFLSPSSHAAQTGNVYIKVDRRGAEAWGALAAIIRDENYNVKDSQSGALSCRGIRLRDGSTSTKKWSNHSWGTALDINWSDNPFGVRASTSSTIHRIGQRAEQLRTKGGAKVFKWGGYWSYADPMHFQICATPSQLSVGIDLNSVNLGSGSGGPF